MLHHLTVDNSLLSKKEWVELTVIIAIRSCNTRDIIERLSYVFHDNLLDKCKGRIRFMVVDDGSEQKEKEKIKKKVDELGFDYLYISSTETPVSMGRARNVGARYAKSTYIMFMDVDLVPYDGFFHELLNEIKVQKLGKFANDFIMVGVIYLTKRGIKEFFKQNSDIRKNTAINWLLSNNKELIEKFSTGTSACLYNRDIFLARGGHDELFKEWGFEDLEFNLRMIRKSSKFPLPRTICNDYKNFSQIVEYKGWKSIYRLFGDITFQKGIILFHSWHEVDKASPYIKKGMKNNSLLFQQRCKSYLSKKYELPPLSDPYEGKTLLFSKTNPFIWNYDILSRLGVIHYLDEDSLTESSLIKYIMSNNIDRVLFHNPYASKQRLGLYKAVKSKKIPYIIAERGALSNSIFFDNNGFNAESSSYDPIYWDKKLTQEQYKQVNNYINQEKTSSASLEKQADRMNLSILYSELDIPVDKKILFVPLQRPSDTVIKYFSGNLLNYDEFISLVQEVANHISSDWRIVVKKHPLEDELHEIDGVLYSNANIKDLIEICDSVLLVNSGVGVLSLLWEKPVMYAGDVFYGDDRINNKVDSYQEVLTLLNSDFKCDHETVYRFLYYLIEEFYSFGKFTTFEKDWKDGGRMTHTKDIDFYQIRKLGRNNLNTYVEAKARINTSSILFDRYRNSGFFEEERLTSKKFDSNISLLQRVGAKIFKFSMFPLLSKTNRQLINRNPRGFFSTAKHPVSVRVGKILRLR